MSAQGLSVIEAVASLWPANESEIANSLLALRDLTGSVSQADLTEAVYRRCHLGIDGDEPDNLNSLTNDIASSWGRTRFGEWRVIEPVTVLDGTGSSGTSKVEILSSGVHIRLPAKQLTDAGALLPSWRPNLLPGWGYLDGGMRDLSGLRCYLNAKDKYRHLVFENLMVALKNMGCQFSAKFATQAVTSRADNIVVAVPWSDSRTLLEATSKVISETHLNSASPGFSVHQGFGVGWGVEESGERNSSFGMRVSTLVADLLVELESERQETLVAKQESLEGYIRLVETSVSDAW